MYATSKTPAMNGEKKLFYLHWRPHDVFGVPVVIDICSTYAFAQSIKNTRHATQPPCHMKEPRHKLLRQTLTLRQRATNTSR